MRDLVRLPDVRALDLRELDLAVVDAIDQRVNRRRAFAPWDHTVIRARAPEITGPGPCAKPRTQ